MSFIRTSLATFIISGALWMPGVAPVVVAAEVLSCEDMKSIYFFVSENHLRFQYESADALKNLRSNAFENVSKALMVMGHPFAAALFDRQKAELRKVLATQAREGEETAGAALFSTVSLDALCQHLGNSLFRAAYLKALVRELDPFSDFITTEEVDIKTSSLDGQFTGVGIGTEPFEDFLKVNQVLKTGPAEGKILVGDLIARIDGHSVAGLTDADIRFRIRGPRGSMVRFEGLRASQPFQVAVTRDLIHQPSIAFEWTDDKILKLKIQRFYRQTAEEAEKILKTHVAKARGVLLDLRDNPGGLLQAARDLVDLFVGQGVVVYLKGKDVLDQVWALKPGGFTKIPLVILVNENTASAAEIVAGSLQDYGRALVVGQKTFGKACVQNIYETNAALGISYKGGLKLTTLWYYLPSGKNVSLLEPDFAIPDPSADVKRISMPFHGPAQIDVERFHKHLRVPLKSYRFNNFTAHSSDHEVVGRRLLKDMQAQK